MCCYHKTKGRQEEWTIRRTWVGQARTNSSKCSAQSDLIAKGSRRIIGQRFIAQSFAGGAEQSHPPASCISHLPFSSLHLSFRAFNIAAHRQPLSLPAIRRQPKRYLSSRHIIFVSNTHATSALRPSVASLSLRTRPAIALRQTDSGCLSLPPRIVTSIELSD